MEDITVNPDEKTITWAAPAEPNGIIVGYRVQYWELGRRDTTEEVNTTAGELKHSYSNFSKCSTPYTTLTIHHNSNMAPSYEHTYLVHVRKSHSKNTVIAQTTGAGVPHKVQVQAATVAGLGESRVVEEVLFSEEQGTVYIRV